MSTNNVLEQVDAKATREIFKSIKVGSIVPQNLHEAYAMADVLFKSGLFPDLATANQGLVKILAGAEFGMSPMASLSGFHIVKSRIMAHYSVIAWRVKQVGFDYKVIEHTADNCVIEFFGAEGDLVGESVFGLNDALAAGVGPDSKDGARGMLKKFPATMLFARAMSQGARMFCPEAFNGMVVYSLEERAHFEQDVEAEDDKTVGTSQRLANRITQDVPEEFSDFLGGPDSEVVVEPVAIGAEVKTEEVVAGEDLGI